MIPHLSIDTPVNIFWFRRDLRLEDNRGLYEALQSDRPVLPLFIFDTNILEKLTGKTDPRVTFIYRTLLEINQKLKKTGRSLLILQGEPARIWRRLIGKIRIGAVYTNHDYEPYARTRDRLVHDLLKTANIPFYTFKDQVIFEKSEILSGKGNPYTVYTPYMRRWRSRLKAAHLMPYPSKKFIHTFIRADFAPPRLEELGFKTSDLVIPERNLNEKIVQSYDKTRDFPAIPGTSRIGIHLRFGTFSIRQLVNKALTLNEIWLQELIWREFFMMILWHFPSVVDHPFREKYAHLRYLNDDSLFKRWCEGQTGYPFVDAGMRELNKTGFMHNRARMITASFLSKHLLIDWRWGERYFAEKLLDYELASNNGNWQWAAGCGCDAAPYFRIFNPLSQAEKFDPQKIYIKKWIPEVGTEDYPAPLIDHQYARQRALSFYEMIKNR